MLIFQFISNFSPNTWKCRNGQIYDAILQIAIVVGGGNIFRGASWEGCSGLDRSSADYIGCDFFFNLTSNHSRIKTIGFTFHISMDE